MTIHMGGKILIWMVVCMYRIGKLWFHSLGVNECLRCMLVKNKILIYMRVFDEHVKIWCWSLKIENKEYYLIKSS